MKPHTVYRGIFTPVTYCTMYCAMLSYNGVQPLEEYFKYFCSPWRWRMQNYLCCRDTEKELVPASRYYSNAVYIRPVVKRLHFLIAFNMSILFLIVWTKILMSFSLIQNTNTILDTTQKEGNINCLHGMRFISITWVILGHSYLFVIFNISKGLDVILIYL